MDTRRFSAGDWVAVILAVGVSLSILVLITGIMWGAIKHGQTASTITENEVQVLLAAFSGIFGILGAFLGFRAANGNKQLPPVKFPPTPPEDEITKEWPAT